jgi:opacity protein-like surface antigen
MNQRLAILIGPLLLGAGLSASAALAQVPAGFYGGVVRTDPSAAPVGVVLGDRQPLGLSDAGLPSLGEGSSDRRLFGGYRWNNQLALEAVVAHSESYALRPFGTGAPGGVGLDLAQRGAPSIQSAWNVDVVGSYTFRSALAFYGRVGYAMPDAGIAAPAPLPAFVDARGLPRDGVNYGLGVRYDFTRAFGLNLEYTRFGRFAYESFGGPMPESDQVRFGLRYRF